MAGGGCKLNSTALNTTCGVNCTVRSSEYCHSTTCDEYAAIHNSSCPGVNSKSRGRQVSDKTTPRRPVHKDLLELNSLVKHNSEAVTTCSCRSHILPCPCSYHRNSHLSFTIQRDSKQQQDVARYTFTVMTATWKQHSPDFHLYPPLISYHPVSQLTFT